MENLAKTGSQKNPFGCHRFLMLQKHLGLKSLDDKIQHLKVAAGTLGGGVLEFIPLSLTFQVMRT